MIFDIPNRWFKCDHCEFLEALLFDMSRMGFEAPKHRCDKDPNRSRSKADER